MIGRRMILAGAVGAAGTAVLGKPDPHEVRNVPLTIEIDWGKSRDVESALADLRLTSTRLTLGAKDTPLGRYWGEADFYANAIRAAVRHPWARIASYMESRERGQERRKITVWNDGRFLNLAEDGCVARLRIADIRKVMA